MAGTASLGAAVFGVVVVGLHAVTPRFDARTRLISELASGRHGAWLLLAFVGLSVSFFSVGAIVSRSGGARVLRALLYVASAAFLLGGLVPLDAGVALHLGCVLAGFAAAVFAIYLFPETAGGVAGALPRRVHRAFAAAVCAGVVLGFTVLPVGIGQRLSAASLCAWLFVLGLKTRAIAD